MIVGTQWGDEGKAKVIDLLASDLHAGDAVVRYQGGHNAGHTVVVAGEKFAFRLVPSGVLVPGVGVFIGNGVVVDPATLIGELDALGARNVDTSGLLVSGQAHLILPYHPIIDSMQEAARGANSIGTTKNGIGPAYVDKAARIGLRVGDLLDRDRFAERLRGALEEKNRWFASHNAPELDASTIEDQYLNEFAPRLAPFIGDTVSRIHELLEAGGTVLFEGAQATFLDIDHGTYPYVTSSNPVAGAACAGAGVGPRCLERIIGIAKAYVTRVGHGPFPTELFDATGDLLQERGREFGTVTGRRRRCGWFDAVMLRQAARLNSLTEIALTKLDVLDPLETVRICVAYEIDGERESHLPPDPGRFARAVPIFEDLPGWKESIEHCRSWADLPGAAQAYVKRLEEAVGVRIRYVGVGPGRDEIVDLGAQ